MAILNPGADCDADSDTDSEGSDSVAFAILLRQIITWSLRRLLEHLHVDGTELPGVAHVVNE